MHPLIERGRASPDAAVDDKFEPEDPTQLEDEDAVSLSQLLLCSDDKEMFFEKKSWVVYGDWLFTLQMNGLQKYNIATLGGMRGRLLAFNYDIEEGSVDNKSSLFLLEGQLYLRHEGAKPAPFSKIDMKTLELTKMTDEELAKFPETPEDQEEVARTLRWESHNEKSGRCLEEAQMFTDGRYLYTISRQIPTQRQLDA